MSSLLWLTDGAFHLELDQPVELNRVLHRKLLDERLDEAVDHHHEGFLLGQDDS